MKSVPEVLNELANESSKNRKVEILKENDNPELRKVLRYAYDPFKRFYISKEQWQGRQYRNAGGDRSTPLSSGFPILDELSNRSFTGNDALELVTSLTKDMSLDNRSVLSSIVGKDLRCGISAKSVNKAFPGLVPEFDVMLADKFNADKWKKFPCYIEPKLDGMRVVVFVKEDGTVQFKSRAGKDLPSLDFMADQARTVRDAAFTGQEVMLDGEVLGSTFNDTVSIVRKKDTPATDAVIWLFDAVTAKQGMTIDETLKEGKRKTDFETRRMMLEGARDELESLPNFDIVDVMQVESEEQIIQAYTVFREAGKEGAIVKDPSAYYEFKRSKGWQKIKDHETHDLVVVDLQEGTGKYVGMLGAIIVDYNGVRVYVGSGFSDEERKVLWEDPDQILGAVVEIEAHETTPDGSLRHPRFVRIRQDKEA